MTLDNQSRQEGTLEKRSSAPFEVPEWSEAAPRNLSQKGPAFFCSWRAIERSIRLGLLANQQALFAA